MSIIESLNIAAQVATAAPAPATTVTIETAPVYGAVAQLPNGEFVVDAKAAEEEWTDTVIKHGLSSNLKFIRELEELEAVRKNWEVTEMAASHNRLYAILTGCYAYYYKMKDKGTTKEVREMMKAGLESFANKRGFTSKADAHDMNRVVKAVFGDDRRRVSAYSLALRVAYDYGVLPYTLADWIKQKGGVEEVRKGASSKSGMPLKERAEIAKKVVKNATLDIIKTDKISTLFADEDGDKMVVLVATYRNTGELEIQGVVKTDAAVKAALAAYYSTNKEEIQAAATQAEIAAHNPIADAQSI